MYKVWRNVNIYLFRHPGLDQEETEHRSQEFLDRLRDFVYGLSSEEMVFEIVEEPDYDKLVARKHQPMLE